VEKKQFRIAASNIFSSDSVLFGDGLRNKVKNIMMIKLNLFILAFLLSAVFTFLYHTIGDILHEPASLRKMAVFWDYPKFTDEDYLREYLEDKKDENAYYWVMNRFLEHGRVVDAFSFFSIEGISKNINKLKLSKCALKKWQRMIEVYG
jgi:hypothetical protein